MSDRLTKLNSLLQQEISTFFLNELPHVFVTITRVEVSPDLHQAIVWVSFLDKQGSQLQELRSHLKELRRRLGQRLRLKNVPNLQLQLDRGIEYSEHISEVIQTIHKEQP